MAIKPFKRKGSPYWYLRGTHQGVSIRESTGIFHHNKIRPPQIVEDKIREIEKQINEGLIYGLKYNATFEQAAENYLKQGGSPRFLQKVIEVMGGMLIRDIDQQTLDAMAFKVYPYVSPQTRNRQFYTPFISVWNANTNGQNSLCSPVQWKRPKVTKKKKATITKASNYNDVVTFLNALNKSVSEIMFFMFYTGCRPIETILLDCSDVNLDGRWIILNNTKTDEPRGMPVHECLVPMLRRRLEHGGALFLNTHGRRWPDTREYNKEGRIIKQCGGQFQTPINTAQDKTGLKITPYTARHTVATYLIYPGGVNETVKNEIIGHGDKGDISLDYIHLPRQAHLDAINKLPMPIGLRQDLLE